MKNGPEIDSPDRAARFEALCRKPHTAPPVRLFLVGLLSTRRPNYRTGKPRHPSTRRSMVSEMAKSDNRFHRKSQITRLSHGSRVVDTEFRDLEDACDMIAAQQARAKAAAVRKSRPLTLKEEFAAAKGRSRLLKYHGKISLAPVGGVSHNKRGIW